MHALDLGWLIGFEFQGLKSQHLSFYLGLGGLWF